MRILRILQACMLLSSLPVVSEAQSVGATPHQLIYKTKRDYSKYVAVELSEDRKTLTYYPAPTDMRAISKLKPVKLHKDYWLSKTGISGNTAYLAITSSEYAKMKKVPDEARLMKLVKYKDVVTEIYDCGKRGAMTEKQINDLIDNDQLETKCKKLK